MAGLHADQVARIVGVVPVEPIGGSRPLTGDQRLERAAMRGLAIVEAHVLEVAQDARRRRDAFRLGGQRQQVALKSCAIGHPGASMMARSTAATGSPRYRLNASTA
jgi:hypothetical protein